MTPKSWDFHEISSFLESRREASMKILGRVERRGLRGIPGRLYESSRAVNKGWRFTARMQVSLSLLNEKIVKIDHKNWKIAFIYEKKSRRSNFPT